ncbi:MAG: DUF2142 domain-containing protein [Lachnospiraceae bacterium]|nr:DUF2142 domain-containing protein [Lachnospiraceae bacterium]
MKKLCKFLKEHKKETVIGYVILCLLYLVIQIVRPRSVQYIELFSVKKIVMHTMIFLCVGVALYSSVFIEEKSTPKTKKIKSLSNFQKIWDKHHNLIGMFLVLFVGLYGCLYVYRTDIRVAMNTTNDVVISAVGTGKIKISDNVKKIKQDFTTTEQELIGISPSFYMENPAVDRAGVIEAVVWKNNQKEIARTTIDVSEIDNGFSWKIIFAEKETQADSQTYTLEISFPENISPYKMSMAVTNEDSEKAVVNEKAAKYGLYLKGHTDLNHFARPYFLVICGILTVFSVLMYYLLFIKKTGLEWCAFFSILVVGGIYGFLVTPYMVPDEAAHIDMAYRYADILMNTGNTEDMRCLKRVEDAEKMFLSDPCLENYRYVYENIGKMAKNTEIVDAEAAPNSGAYLFMHLPGVVGIILARIFQLGYVQLLFLGRFLGLFVFALAVFFGMKKLPFGKATLYVLAMLPITLQQANSFSYDSILFSAALLFICYIISMAYSEEDIRPLEIIFSSILGVAIIYCKSGAYTPLVFAILLIPMKKFASKSAYYSFMGSLSGAFLLGFLVKNVKVVNATAEATNKVMGIAEAITIPNYSLSYILQNPMVLFDVINNTIADKTDFYIQSMLGQHLGWIQVELANVLVIAFAIILMLSAFRARGEKQYVTTGNKWWILVITCASAALVLIGMLVSWTPITYVSVEGVQGRYFFPILLLGLMMLRNSKIIFDKSADRAVAYAGYATTVIAALCFIHVVL